MNSKIILSVTALMITLGASAQKVEHYKIREAAKLNMPVMTDTVGVDGAKFDKAALLSIPVTSAPGKYEWTSVTADTAGIVSIERPDQGQTMYVLETRLRPERYVKGNLEITSDAMFELLVDGESKTKKESSDSAMTAASPKTVQLTMLPQTEHVVTIKLIAQADTLAPIGVKTSFVADEKFADVVVDTYAEGQRNFELRDLSLGCRVYSMSISPDGKYLLTKYSERFSRDNTRSFATLTDLKTGKTTDGINTQTSWMPKGSRLYYTVKGQDGFDVYVLDPATMRESRMLTNIPKRDFKWAPDESFLIYYQDADVKKPGSPLRRYTSPDDRIPDNRDRSFACIYYPSTGVSQPLVFGERISYVMGIRPDSKALILGVSDYDSTEWPFYFKDLYEIDLTTMTADTLLTHDSSVSSVDYSPDGKRLFVIGGPRAFDNIGLNSGDHPIANDSDMQGFIMDIATGNVTPMTKDFAPSLCEISTWNAADNTIYFIAEKGFGHLLYSLNPETGAIKEFDHGITYIQNFTIGNDESRWLAYYGQSSNSSGRGYLVDLKNDKTTLVADPWQEVAADIEWGDTRRWCFTASDGTEIEGFITCPPDFDPQKKYPMIVYYYGGTAPTLHNTYSPYNAQLFASRGYVVYQLNPSGTTGYGQEFSARHVNAWGDRTIEDIIEGVTKITEEHPYIDSSKIGCIGASYGGFITQYLMTRTDMFAAAVSHAGISNVTSYWGEGYWGYSYNALAAAKSYPWNNPDLYTKHGSLFNADKIHTPLLLTHGTADTNVPVGESIQLFNALKILGREVEMVTVDDEDHYISDYDKRILWQNSIMAWFAKWLQDDPRWWDELYR